MNAHREAKLRGLLAAFIVLISLAVMMTLTAVIYLLLQVDSQGNDAEIRLEKIQETRNRVLDCTEPNGKCYGRIKNQTDNAVQNVNKIAIYAASCADQPYTQTVKEIESCIVRELAEEDGR